MTTVSAFAATAGGSLMPLAILLPALGVLMSLLIGGRQAERIVFCLMPVELAVAAAIAYFVWRSGQPLVYALGGYEPPLGIALRADGFSAVMLVTTGLIAPAAALFARANFATPEGSEKRAPLVFWILLQGIQAALSLIFLSGDLFNLYVGLELLTFAAAPLVCLDGPPETLAAALRYLLFALFGSVFYLLGVALLYGAYGALDIAILYRDSVFPHSARARSLVGGRADDGRALGEDRAFPAAFVVAPGPRQCARRGERGVVGAGGEGIVLPRRPALVRRVGVSPRRDPRDDPRRARFGGDPVRQRAGSASGAAEAAHRLFDGGADRLPVPDVPAWPRSLGRGRVQRRRNAGFVARLRQGGDVPVRGPHRRIPRP
jgi:hypothetical protein